MNPEAIVKIIQEKSGVNPVVVDVRNKTTTTDFLIIAEGYVHRHVIALAHAIIAECKEHGIRPIHTEGMQEGDWVILDFPGVMIHLFSPGLREKYSLESLWGYREFI